MSITDLSVGREIEYWPQVGSNQLSKCTLKATRVWCSQQMIKLSRACGWPRAAAGLPLEVETYSATWLEKGDTWESLTPHMMTGAQLPPAVPKAPRPLHLTGMPPPFLSVWQTPPNLHSAPLSSSKVPLHLIHTFSVAYFLTMLQSPVLRSTFPTGVWITTGQGPYHRLGHTV